LYSKIVVPLDGSELAECILPHLEAFAAGNPAVVITLVRVVTPIEIHYKAALPIDEKQEKLINEAAFELAEEYLLKVKKRLAASRINVSTSVLSGQTVSTLIDYIKKSGADLLFVATHGRSGLNRLFMGSVADKLVHSSDIPIFLIRPSGTCPS
jgi:nucleotide-binding universal stress UspA family protein